MDDVKTLEHLGKSVAIIGAGFETMAQISKAFADQGVDVIVIDADRKVLEDEFLEARKRGLEESLKDIELAQAPAIHQPMQPHQLHSKMGERHPNEFYFKGKHITNGKWKQRQLKNHLRNNHRKC